LQEGPAVLLWLGMFAGLELATVWLAGRLLRRDGRKVTAMYPMELVFGTAFVALTALALISACFYPLLPAAWRAEPFLSNRGYYLGAVGVGLLLSALFLGRMILRYRRRRRLISGGERRKPSRLQYVGASVRLPELGARAPVRWWTPPPLKLLICVWGVELHSFEYGYSVALRTYDGEEVFVTHKGLRELPGHAVVCYSEERPEFSCPLLEDVE
jgi:hypothetical protein